MNNETRPGVRDKLHALNPLQVRRSRDALKFIDVDNLETAKRKIKKRVKKRLERAVKRHELTSTEMYDGLALISRSFEYMKIKHEESDDRLSGGKYSFHPATVAYWTASDKNIPVELLAVSVATAELHDVLEMTDTLPSEMSILISPEVTAGVLLLSKNIKAFDESHDAKTREQERIRAIPEGERNNAYKGLLRWIELREGVEDTYKVYTDELCNNAPDHVKRIKGIDRLHNLLTQPDPDAVPLHLRDKAHKIREEIDFETENDILPIIATLGITGAGSGLFWSIVRALENSKKSKDLRN